MSMPCDHTVSHDRLLEGAEISLTVEVMVDGEDVVVDIILRPRGRCNLKTMKSIDQWLRSALLSYT